MDAEVTTQTMNRRFRKNWREHLAEKYTAAVPWSYLEIGCFEAQTTRWLLDGPLGHPDSRACVIDPWTGNKGWSGSEVEERARQNLLPYAGKVTIWKGLSQDVLSPFNLATLHPDGGYDLIYLDGDHALHACSYDLEFSWPILKIGGVMVCDDYYVNGVRRAREAVDKFLVSIAGQHTILFISRNQIGFVKVFP